MHFADIRFERLLYYKDGSIGPREDGNCDEFDDSILFPPQRKAVVEV